MFTRPLSPEEEALLSPDQKLTYGQWQQKQELEIWEKQKALAAKQAAKTDKPRGVESHATKLLKMVQELCDRHGAELFHAPSGEGYLRAPIMRHHVDDLGTASLRVEYFENFPLTHGSSAAEYLRGYYLQVTDKSISSGAMHDVIETLNGRARLHGDQHEVYTRIAGFDDRVVLDLASPRREVVIVRPDGWYVDPCPSDVRFVRRPGMQELGKPVATSERLEDLIPTVLNVSGERSIQLLIGWWLVALRALKPYFILAVRGEAGSAKSCGSDIIRSVLDPNEASSSSAPKDERDLMIAARGCHVGSFDNLSYLNDDLSDALCRIATGSGLRTRKLNTDDVEVIFRAARPVILNGIADVLTRSDLASRALVIELDPIADTQRRTERDVYANVERQRPKILGALLTVIAEVLRSQPAMPRPERLPRMADAALTIIAAERALGWDEGTWIKLMDENDEENASTILSGDPISDALNNLPMPGDGKPWAGELKEFIARFLPDTDERGKIWTAKRVANDLRRMTGALRKVGIEVTPPRGLEKAGEFRDKRIWRVLRSGDPGTQGQAVTSLPDPDQASLLAAIDHDVVRGRR